MMFIVCRRMFPVIFGKELIDQSLNDCSRNIFCQKISPHQITFCWKGGRKSSSNQWCSIVSTFSGFLFYSFLTLTFIHVDFWQFLFPPKYFLLMLFHFNSVMVWNSVLIYKMHVYKLLFGLLFLLSRDFCVCVIDCLMVIWTSGHRIQPFFLMYILNPKQLVVVLKTWFKKKKKGIKEKQ